MVVLASFIMLINKACIGVQCSKPIVTPTDSVNVATTLQDSVYGAIYALRIQHPDIVMAQCIEESGHFTSRLFINGHNCTGMKVAQFVAKELVRKFGRKIGKVVFSCVPASSQERNETRNKAFSALVCQLSGAIDGFSHVKVNGERSAVHGTKMKKEVRAKRLEENNTIEVDVSFFRNKIVCVWDDVVTTGTSFCAYAAQLESAGAHVTNGIFLGKTSYRYVPTY